MIACCLLQWILYPDAYLAACKNAKAFVPEQEFEWHFPTKEIKSLYHYREKKAPWLGACRLVVCVLMIILAAIALLKYNCVNVYYLQCTGEAETA